jgi:hypothetical protein
MVKIFPLGESALTIEFSNEISPETNDQVIALAIILKPTNSPVSSKRFRLTLR